MLRVIHVAHQPAPYGIGTLLIDLLRCQKSGYRDIEVAVAFHADGPTMATYRGIGVPVHCLELSSGRDPRIFTRLRKLFRDCDIVNLHSHSPWALLAAKAARKKVVFTFHGALGLRKGRLGRLQKAYLRRLLVRYCDKVTFASASSLSKYENAVGCKGEHEGVEVFPYGLSVHEVVPTKDREVVRRELGLLGCFVVGTAARMCPIKRIDRLIDAFAMLPRENAARLLIMGDGDSAYEAMLHDRVRDHVLNSRVLLLGYRADAIDLIAALDVFVLPTGAPGETFGLALLEAMSLGIPSIVFEDGGGAVEVLGDSGFVVKNPGELCDLIIKLQADAPMRHSVGCRGRTRAELFDISHTADQFYRVYKSLVQCRPGMAGQ